MTISRMDNVLLVLFYRRIYAKYAGFVVSRENSVNSEERNVKKCSEYDEI